MSVSMADRSGNECTRMRSWGDGFEPARDLAQPGVVDRGQERRQLTRRRFDLDDVGRFDAVRRDVDL